MSSVTIWHNPACGTSRNTLALIREHGIEPEVIEYLKSPPTRQKLRQLAAAAGGARAILREKEKLCAELGLDDPARGDEELLDAMERHPILMNRPIVETAAGIRLCRPPDTVLELLAKKG